MLKRLFGKRSSEPVSAKAQEQIEAQWSQFEETFREALDLMEESVSMKTPNPWASGASDVMRQQTGLQSELLKAALDRLAKADFLLIKLQKIWSAKKRGLSKLRLAMFEYREALKAQNRFVEMTGPDASSNAWLVRHEIDRTRTSRAEGDELFMEGMSLIGRSFERQKTTVDMFDVVDFGKIDAVKLIIQANFDQSSSDIYNMDTFEGRSRYVVDNWSGLAMFAYGAFLKFGQGAVVIKNQDGKILTDFMVADSESEGSKVDKWIKEYDPKTELVCLFISETELPVVACYQSGKDLPSPENRYQTDW